MVARFRARAADRSEHDGGGQQRDVGNGFEQWCHVIASDARGDPQRSRPLRPESGLPALAADVSRLIETPPLIFGVDVFVSGLMLPGLSPAEALPAVIGAPAAGLIDPTGFADPVGLAELPSTLLTRLGPFTDGLLPLRTAMHCFVFGLHVKQVFGEQPVRPPPPSIL